jgi:hypothetical protein
VGGWGRGGNEPHGGGRWLRSSRHPPVVEECGGGISRWWSSATAAAAANPRVQKDAQLARLIFLMTHDRGRGNAKASQVRQFFPFHIPEGLRNRACEHGKARKFRMGRTGESKAFDRCVCTVEI